MRKSGKDNSGDKIWRKISSSTSPPDDELGELMPPSPMQRVVGVEGDFLQDVHGHLVVDHDLYNHEGLTEDGIAEAFIEFAKKENLSFFESSPSVTPFDAVRYERLMDGLDSSEVQLNEVLDDNQDFRLDSDYFNLELVQNSIKIRQKQHKKLSEICHPNIITKGETPTWQGFDYVEDGVAFIRSTDLISGGIKKESLVFVPEDYHLLKQRSHIKLGDTLMAIVGATIGEVGYYDLDSVANCNQAVAIIRPYTESAIRIYVNIFLQTKFSRLQIRRLQGGNARDNLDLLEVRRIKVPVLKEFFYEEIEKVFNMARQSRFESRLSYQQAEDLLLSELGLNDWQPTEETVAVKSFAESFLSCDRLDAEYYQPKYDQVEEVIKSCGFPSQNLGSLIEPIQNGFDYREYTEEGTPYIRVGDVKNGQINFESAVKIPITMADVDKPVGLQVGDILFTRKGSFGNSAVVTELEVNGIISSEIMLVRLTSASKKEIIPEYVSLFLNSKFGYLQVERRVHGVAYYSISQPDLANLLIPILPKAQQQKIVEKINSSFSLKLKSKQLLEIAKTGVERAIETDEATATAWIDRQLEVLEVTPLF
jgi:type I restriction enzyme M protein